MHQKKSSGWLQSAQSRTGSCRSRCRSCDRAAGVFRVTTATRDVSMTANSPVFSFSLDPPSQSCTPDILYSRRWSQTIVGSLACFSYKFVGLFSALLLAQWGNYTTASNGKKTQTHAAKQAGSALDWEATSRDMTGTRNKRELIWRWQDVAGAARQGVIFGIVEIVGVLGLQKTRVCLFISNIKRVITV